MKIEEKRINKKLKSDMVIDDILIDAYYGSMQAAKDLRERISKLPQGEIKEQNKLIKDKQYKYYVLVGKGKKRYIKKRRLDYIKQEVEKRKELEKELNKYLNRANYIQYLLKHYDFNEANL